MPRLRWAPWVGSRAKQMWSLLRTLMLSPVTMGDRSCPNASPGGHFLPATPLLYSVSLTLNLTRKDHMFPKRWEECTGIPRKSGCSKEHGFFFQKFPSDFLSDLRVYLKTANYLRSMDPRGHLAPGAVFPQATSPAGMAGLRAIVLKTHGTSQPGFQASWHSYLLSCV